MIRAIRRRRWLVWLVVVVGCASIGVGVTLLIGIGQSAAAMAEFKSD